jgi:hypothetical protein
MRASQKIVASTRLEEAVSWRSDPRLAGHIVVFVRGEVLKLHSLHDLDLVLTRDLASTLLRRASKELGHNLPQRRFWSALQQDLANYPLALMEDFVREVAGGQQSTSAIPKHLWRLRLLRDDAILHADAEPGDRLRRNRDLLLQMGQLSESSRRRMSMILLKTRDAQRTKLKKAFQDLMEYYRLGTVDALQRLDLPTVELLLKAGQPSSEEPKQPTGEPPKHDPDKPLRGNALHDTIAQLLVRPTPENAQGVQELAEHLRHQLDAPDSGPEPITTDHGFSGRILQPDPIPRDLLKLVHNACSVSNWGGTWTTSRPDLKDALRSFQPTQFAAFTPEQSSNDALGQSLISLIAGFDQDLDKKTQFQPILARLQRARTQLLEHLELLVYHPLVLFGATPEARAAVDQYLSAYSDLLHEFREHETALHAVDATATKFVAGQLLRLEVINVKTPTEWKGMLTPLHPFHLWRFREIFKTIHGTTLTAEQQDQLAKALTALPHLLHCLVLCPDVTAPEPVMLPQSGALNTLPTYENRTNRYLGNDGIDLVEDILTRWLDFAPYTEPHLRVALVDAPDLAMGLRQVSAFLEAKPRTTLVLDVYCTRGQQTAADLASLDYDDQDYQVAEHLRNGRLVLYVHRTASLEDACQSLQASPVHLAYLFDQAQYKIGYAPRARQLLVSPLVISYEYDYSTKFNRGIIAPSSQAEDGLFADYHFLVDRAANLPAGQHIRLQHEGVGELEQINKLLNNKGVRWLVVADRALTAYAPDAGILLAEQRAGQRELAIWSHTNNRSLEPFLEILRQFNILPSADRLNELMRRFSHIAAGGLLSLPFAGADSSNREARRKGLLGTILAAAWYTQRYPDALVASLDSQLAQQWLQSRPHTSDRADLIGLRMEGDETLTIEPIEVKTRADAPEVRVERVGNERHLTGRAVDQIRAMLEALAPIFADHDTGHLFTAARREVLKYQLHRECFRETHDAGWRRRWYGHLRSAFTLNNRPINIALQGMIVHVHLEHATSTQPITDAQLPITLATLTAKDIQQLVGTIEPSDDTPPEAPPPPSSPPPHKPVPPQDHAVQPPSTRHHVAEDERQSNAEAEELARLFLRACQSYRVQVETCDPATAVLGPTVWRFYVRLAPGQRLDALRNALEDIGREMRRSGLLVASLPNAAEVALDVPRTTRETVPLERGLACLPPLTTIEELPVVIGVTPEGTDIIRDVSKMPHMLVGGTTGAGKTVFLYGLLCSMLRTHPNPDSMRLLLSTSKPEDFTFFEGLPHLETGNIITDAAQAVHLLDGLVNDTLEDRKPILHDAHCRDIVEYNARHKASPIPPLVVIVDEFADLADQLSRDRAGRDTFYKNVRRVAQLGRSRGVHLILCTQRPSADLVPTNIRNLLNSRIALHVNDTTASRMILEEPGAEQLQLHGDLLLKEHAALTRAQGYYISTEELETLLGPLKPPLHKPKRSPRH